MKLLLAFWKKHKKLNIAILKTALGLALFYNIYSKFSEKGMHDTIDLFIREFSPEKLYFLIFVIALTFFNWGFETLKYYLCVQRVEKISYWKAYRGILYGNALNLVLPASIGELTGRPLVLKEENRINGSGVAYYVSIVQKVASPLVGLGFLFLAFALQYLPLETISLIGLKINLTYLVAILSIIDVAIWFLLFLYPETMIRYLAKIKMFQKVFEKMENFIHYNIQTKLTLIAIGSIRFFIFVSQYWLLMFVFFDQFPYLEFFILCGVYFLVKFLVPSFGFLDVGIRANMVLMVFSLYTNNLAQLLAVNYLIWIINLLIPSLFGFYLMRNTFNPFKQDIKEL